MNNIGLKERTNTKQRNVGNRIPNIQKGKEKECDISVFQIPAHSKTINLALFGCGNVGSTLIQQIREAKDRILEKKSLKLNIFAIADSKRILIDKNGIGTDWKRRIIEEGKEYQISDLIEFANLNRLENLIAVDNTASKPFIEKYTQLIENGFNLVSSNKIANTLSYLDYENLRKSLKQHKREYLYETNVGAGLPLIDTISLLHLSGEKITKIRGVFSGSISYIFNRFSVEKRKFSQILKEAIDLGYTEPDPREDLSGNDVARKLLILARELDLKSEWEEIEIQNLIPKELQNMGTRNFLQKLEGFDFYFGNVKKQLDSERVLRYVGELSSDFHAKKGLLRTQLVEVQPDSVLGRLKGSDSLFEIYTENYGETPIVIQGAGAGAKVTARGVLGDILRLAVLSK